MPELVGHLLTGRRLRTCAVLFALALSPILNGCGEDAAAKKARHFRAGSDHLDAGRLREAVIELRNAVDVDPRFGEARAKLASAYEQLGDGPNALSEYVRAADLLPNDLNIHIATGNYLVAARRASDALARADAVLQRDPKHIEGHILRGNALGGLNQLDRALAEMEEALRLDPSRGITYTQIGLVEAARGEAQAAEAAFERAVDLAPDNVGCRLALANFYWASGRLSEAEKALEAALTLDPANEGTNRALAVFALASGRVGEAEQYLTRFVELSKAPASIFTLAEYYMATRRSAKALELLEPLANSAVSGARQRLARAYAIAGETAKAHRLVDEILSQSPNDGDAMLLKSQLLIEGGKRAEALGVLRLAVAADPRAIGAHFALGKLHAARGDSQGAEAAFREVLRLNPSASAARVELALLQLSSGAHTASLRDAEEAAVAAPQSRQARMALIRSLLASKQFDRADVELKALHAVAPDQAAVHVQIGVLAASRNQNEGARMAFERALAIDARSVEGLAGLIALDLNAKNFASARQRVDRALAAGPAAPDLLLLGARTYGTVGDWAAAERVLRQAIVDEPTLLPAYGMLAQVYVAQNKLDAARQEFDNLARQQSSPVQALTMAGLILQAQGDTAGARERYERAVRHSSTAVVAANNLAWLYAERNERLGDALRLARSAADQQPQLPEVQHTLGWVYFQSGLPVMAVGPLTIAVERAPASALYRYHLGLALSKAGDVAGSRAAIARALELDDAAAWAADARRLMATLSTPAGRQ
jgi:tetratricopeptide (TPR) repeat protein